MRSYALLFGLFLSGTGIFLLTNDDDRFVDARVVSDNLLERFHGTGPGYAGFFNGTCDKYNAIVLGSIYHDPSYCPGNDGAACVQCPSSNLGNILSGWTSTSGYNYGSGTQSNCGGYGYTGYCDFGLCDPLGGALYQCSDIPDYAQQTGGGGT